VDELEILLFSFGKITLNFADEKSKNNIAFAKVGSPWENAHFQRQKIIRKRNNLYQKWDNSPNFGDAKR